MLSNIIKDVQTNRFNIANLALIRLGLNPLLTMRDLEKKINGNDKTVLIMLGVLDTAIISCLEELPWNFAMRYKNLVPYDDQDGGYQIPSDCATFVGLGDEDDCCMSYIDMSTISKLTDQADPHEKINENRSTQNYIENVAFRIINNRLYFTVNTVDPICCDYGYLKLFYVSKDVDNMLMNESFKLLCALKVAENILTNVMSDQNATLRQVLEKKYYLTLKDMIKREFEQFKYKLSKRDKINRTDLGGERYCNGFTISPFIR